MAQVRVALLGRVHSFVGDDRDGLDCSFRFVARVRLTRRLGVIPTLSGSTLTKALSDSWNVNGCNDTGFALGMICTKGK